MRGCGVLLGEFGQGRKGRSQHVQGEGELAAIDFSPSTLEKKPCQVSRGSGLPSATGGGNYGHNLVMTQTTVEGGEQQQQQQQQASSANKDHTEIHIP